MTTLTIADLDDPDLMTIEANRLYALDDRALWLLASDILEEHGEHGTGDFIMDHFNAVRRVPSAVKVEWWMKLIDCIQMLNGGETVAVYRNCPAGPRQPPA